jgi:hypothetical protein
MVKVREFVVSQRIYEVVGGRNCLWSLEDVVAKVG